MKRIMYFIVALMAVISLSSCGGKGVTLSGVDGGGNVVLGRDSTGKLKVESVQLWLNGNVGFGNYYSPYGGNYGGNYANWYQNYSISTTVLYVTGPPTNLLKVPVCDRWGNIVGTALCTDAPIYYPYPNNNVVHYPGKFSQLQNRDYGLYGWAPVYVSINDHQTDRDPTINGEIVQ